MSYNQKPPGSSGSGMGGTPPNGPNNIPQVAKTFAGIQQQMQNLVHGQNAIPQSSQADINAFLQQQRIQNMLKQQQQFLQFQHQMQQQQHQQQQHQHHNMAGGGGVGPNPVSGVPGAGVVAAPSSGSAGSSGEPLALTRTAGAAELLNKTYQQQANGNPTANPTFNQLQQTLQALPTNFVQQLQVFQYQMQAKQMQQQHGGGQAQHGHGQQQPVQGVPPPTPATSGMSHQQQQQKHQNQHQQQQQNALSRYLTAAAQAAAVSGNKMSSATSPPPPPLTNQMKPPNLPPNTQITPVTAANIAGGSISVGPHPKMSTGNAATGSAKHPAPPPSISLTPSKAAALGPSVAHQQNKFTPPTNSGTKGGHMGHLQNAPKSTHCTTHTATSNTASPVKTGTSADATATTSKSPQSTPVQLTKQTPPSTAAGSKTLASTTTSIGANSTMVSPLKYTVTTPATSLAPITTNTLTTSAAVAPNITTTTTNIAAANATSTKTAISGTIKSVVDESAATKLSLKSANDEKEALKTSLNEIGNKIVDSTDGNNKDADKSKEMKLESAEVNKSAAQPTEIKDSLEKANTDLISNSAKTATSITSSTSIPTQLESKAKVEKFETSVKMETDNVNENKLSDAKKSTEKNKPKAVDEMTSVPATTPPQEAAKHSKASVIDDKKQTAELNPIKNSQDEKKLESKEKLPEKEKDKAIKSNNSLTKVEQLEIVPLKTIQNSEAESDKLGNIKEIKTKTTPPTTTPAQHFSLKTLEKDEANTKNLLETSESEQSRKEEQLEIVSASKNDNKYAKEHEEPSKPTKSAETSETNTLAKTDLPQSAELPQSAANKTSIEDNVNDSNLTVQKEAMAAAVATPAKKVGRLAKAAKSKSVASATSVESKTTELQEEKPAASSTRVKRKSKAVNSESLDVAPSTPKDDDLDRKSKRHRLKTILYQSPLPELAYITKLSASEASNSPKPLSNEDRLIVFYKNEYMAVRNAEGTFYLCQTMQNVYRTSPRISIRWLSEDANDSNVFIPDFYDHTDIECVLTTVELKRIDKGHLRLPKGERNRIESILKKAIDVEKGLVPRPELTEENPDGLDISLFKDESQIEKKSALSEGTENQTPSITATRKSRRGNTAAASSLRKSTATSSNLVPIGYKRKRDATLARTSSHSSRKTLTKKRKTLVKRKKKIDNSDEDDDDDETSDDCESDTEYKPTQKRSSLSASGASRSAPRAQRSPLAKARAASPITPTTSRSKNVPQKTTSTPSTSKVSRGERAAKRKSVTDGGSSEEVSTTVKKPTTISNNKSKGTKH